MEVFCNAKDRTLIINQFFVVYEFTSPGCGANYLGKTKRIFYERCVEHAWSDQNSIVKNHLDQCAEVQHLLDITSLVPALFSYDNNIGSTDNRNSCINLVIDNTKIIDRYKKINIPFFKEKMKL